MTDLLVLHDQPCSSPATKFNAVINHSTVQTSLWALTNIGFVENFLCESIVMNATKRTSLTIGLLCLWRNYETFLAMRTCFNHHPMRSIHALLLVAASKHSLIVVCFPKSALMFKDDTWASMAQCTIQQSCSSISQQFIGQKKIKKAQLSSVFHLGPKRKRNDRIFLGQNWSAQKHHFP